MCLKHPQTILPSTLVYGKIIFHEVCPWCQKGWATAYCLYCYYKQRSLFKGYFDKYYYKVKILTATS